VPLTIAYEVAPRCYLVLFGDEWIKRESFEKHLLSALQLAKRHSDTVWLNGALSLKHGAYFFRPYADFAYRHHPANPLLEFIFRVNRGVSSIPAGCIDVGRYRPSVSESEEG
jgi:hypothetical protein